MARVRVYGRMTGERRQISLGGRGRNNYIESWINFDAGKKKEFTESITTRVQFNEINGKIYVEIDCRGALELPEDIIEIKINGIHIGNRKDIMKMSLKELAKSD